MTPQLETFLRNTQACAAGSTFARRYRTMHEVWNRCHNPDWMRWMYQRQKGTGNYRDDCYPDAHTLKKLANRLGFTWSEVRMAVRDEGWEVTLSDTAPHLLQQTFRVIAWRMALVEHKMRRASVAKAIREVIPNPFTP